MFFDIAIECLLLALIYLGLFLLALKYTWMFKVQTSLQRKSLIQIFLTLAVPNALDFVKQLPHVAWLLLLYFSCLI
jgi:hypothetical protein